MDPNPYAPPSPQVLAGAAPVDLDFEIRAREHFTAGWMTLWYLVFPMAVVGGTVLGIGLTFGFFSSTAEPLSEIIGILALAISFPICYTLMLPYLSCGGHNHRLIAAILRHRHANAELSAGVFITELHLGKTLPRPGSQRLDNADDMGAVLVDDGQLRFLGDACSITLTQEQIAAIEPFGRSGELGYLGAKTRVTLNEPLSGQISFCVTIREGFPIWKAWRRAQDLQNALIDWHIGPGTEQFISPTAVAPEPADH